MTKADTFHNEVLNLGNEPTSEDLARLARRLDEMVDISLTDEGVYYSFTDGSEADYDYVP